MNSFIEYWATSTWSELYNTGKLTKSTMNRWKQGIYMLHISDTNMWNLSKLFVLDENDGTTILSKISLL